MGEIRKRLDNLGLDRAFGNSDRYNLDLVALKIWGLGGLFNNQRQADQKLSNKSRLVAVQELQSTVRGNPRGLEYLTALLETAKSEMTSEGQISETLRSQIFDAFSLWDYLFAGAIRSDHSPAEKGKSSSSEEIGDVADKQADRERAFVIAVIDLQLKRIRRLEECAMEREKLEIDAEARSFSLPPVDATDKLLRYEAHLDRQLFRAMDELERLQRQRRGENVAPALNINLSRRS